ncbi:MAG: hypothetical protein PHR06_08030 [Candidatus Cloacimonetes bacterium]|nr:hypothetical protein [Candidatus Cloacimonadota bacterium]
MKIKSMIVFLVIVISFIGGCSSSEDTYDAPKELAITKVDSGKLKLTWRYTDSSKDLTFTIARKMGEDGWADEFYTTEDDSKVFIDEVDTENFSVVSYKVRANNNEQGNSSTFSMPVAFFPDKAKPSDLQAQQINQENIQLTWVDNAIGEDGYRIGKKSGETWIENYAVVDANATTFTDSVYSLFTEVSYRVSAFVHESYSAALELTFMPIFSAPSELTLEQLSISQVRVAWQDNSEGELGFHLQRRIGAGANGDYDWGNTITLTENSTEYVDIPNVEAGTLYYRVRAFKDTMFSNYTEIKSINFNLKDIGEVNLPAYATDVHVTGQYAFIANEYSGIQVVNISNQQNPVLVMNITDPVISGKVLSVYVDEDSYLYATNQNGGLSIFDVYDMENPSFVEYIPFTFTEFQPLDVEVGTIDNQKYAFVAGGSAGLIVVKIDIYGQLGSMIVGRHNTHGVAYEVEKYNNTLYLADDSNGVYQFNVSDPENPVVDNVNYSIQRANSLFIYGNKLFVGCGERGLEILDRATLERVNSFLTQGYVKEVAVQGRFAYLADNNRGLTILDIQLIDDLKEIANITTETNANSLMIKDSYAYIGTNNKLLIIQIIP